MMKQIFTFSAIVLSLSIVSVSCNLQGEECGHCECYRVSNPSQTKTHDIVCGRPDVDNERNDCDSHSHQYTIVGGTQGQNGTYSATYRGTWVED